MARRRTKKRKSRGTRKKPLPGWVWMLFGLVAGLSVSAFIYLGGWQALPAGGEAATKAPAQPKKPLAKSAPEKPPKSKFTFYDMLPNFEVVIPEEEEAVRPAVKREPVKAPGVYVLQAGSFSSFADADRAKAQLALLGVVSRIQKVSVDDKTYHRVRIGPVNDLNELNELRQRLQKENVETMVIRIGE